MSGERTGEVPPPVDVTPPGEDGAYYCETCAKYVARSEVRVLGPEGRVKVPACPTCGRHVVAERSQRSRSLDRVLLEAVRWPLSRAMLPTLLSHTFVFWFFSSWWAVGLLPITLVGLVFALGVLATYGAAVIRSTQRGDDDAPPPSDLVASWDVIGAVVRHTAVILVGGLPLIVAMGASVLGDGSLETRTVLVVVGLVSLCLYVPAGQIVASTRETFTAALNPIPPILFAIRVGGSYFLACAIFLGITLAHVVAIGASLMVGVALFGAPTVLWGIVVALVTVVGVLVEARMLGLIVREHRFDVELI